MQCTCVCHLSLTHTVVLSVEDEAQVSTTPSHLCKIPQSGVQPNTSTTLVDTADIRWEETGEEGNCEGRERGRGGARAVQSMRERPVRAALVTTVRTTDLRTLQYLMKQTNVHHKT